MSYLSHLECASGGARFPADRLQNNCCDGGDILEARYDMERLRREVRREDIARGPSSLWRYAPLLPANHPEDAVTLGEGWTPLLSAPALSRELGLRHLFIKDEGRNPSGTFKDRGASVAMTRLRELGAPTVIHNSSGNAGAAWALYAARAGITCVNLLAEDVLGPSLQQSSLAGARTYVVHAPWQQSGAMVAEAAERHGWFNVGTLREPYRLEGKKTMGYEICEQLGWETPDVVFYPTGGALGAIAIFKAFRELRALGWIGSDSNPRLVVVQYEGCAPIVRAFRDGKDDVETWENLDILPGGLKSPTPPGGRAILGILRETGGAAITVSSKDSLDAVQELARLEGVFACPEGAATLAGLKKALDDGLVGRDERIVLLNTGSGLKSNANMGKTAAHVEGSAEDIDGPDAMA